MSVEANKAAVTYLDQARNGASAGYPLLSAAELAALPPPSWLIDGMVPAGGLNVLYGASGAGKSFLGLDFALCTATGLAWWGRDVAQGGVAFIAAEGVAGLSARVDAWTQERSPTICRTSAFSPSGRISSRRASLTARDIPWRRSRESFRSSSSTRWRAAWSAATRTPPATWASS